MIASLDWDPPSSSPPPPPSPASDPPSRLALAPSSRLAVNMLSSIMRSVRRMSSTFVTSIAAPRSSSFIVAGDTQLPSRVTNRTACASPRSLRMVRTASAISDAVALSGTNSKGTLAPI